MGKTSPLLLVGVMATVLFIVLFMIGFILLAAAFTNKGGDGNSASSGGSLDGECDFDKILGSVADGKVQGIQTAKSRVQKMPPEKYIPMYEKAAEKFKLGGCGPAMLAGIHNIETNFGGDGSNSSANYAGAAGPFQFLSGSWAGFANDCAGVGKGTWPTYTVQQGACAAAAHVSGDGKAPKNWKEGIFSYNHANWYVYSVVYQAKRYAEGGK